MKKTFKKIAASVMAVATIFSMSVITASAKYNSYEFEVRTSSNDGMKLSAGNPKDDNDQFPVIYTESGNINSNDRFYMSVFKSYSYNESNRVTNWKQITSNSARYDGNDIRYNTWRGAKSINYLCGDTDRYYVRVSGHWYS